MTTLVAIQILLAILVICSVMNVAVKIKKKKKVKNDVR
jgi:hypothetical protein